MTPLSTGLDKLRLRIQALRAKTIENGCTEAEALSAAAKVAELLDRYELSLTDVELREEQCERVEFVSLQKKRIPIEACLGAVAAFCDCRAWREKSVTGAFRYVFFGLSADAAAALCLTELVDGAIRSELGRYKTSPEYLRFRHAERHMANGSFALGMADSIATKLLGMKAARDDANRSNGRELVILKRSIVEEELARQHVELRPLVGASRQVSMIAYEAGGVAGEAVILQVGTGTTGR